MTGTTGSDTATPYVLGIDLGSASVGWAILRQPAPSGNDLVATGVRVFDPGVTGEVSDIEAGKDEARGKERRDARQARRQCWRRAWRMKRLFRELQAAALLPPTLPGEHPDEPTSRYATIERLDAELRERWLNAGSAASPAPAGAGAAAQPAQATVAAPSQVLPYLLRARALDQRLEPFEIGRAIYHLAQRRGFLSNRLAAPKDDEKESEVYSGISALAAKMQEANARTLGEYFSRLDPREERIRDRWTARRMYEREFDLIWAPQAAHHPQLLTARLCKRLRRLVFYQRALKSASGLIGQCELEKGQRRAPWACLEAQRFRLVQSVNNLRVTSQGSRELTPDERSRLLAALEGRKDMTFEAVGKLVGLRGERFNLEAGGEKKLKGNRTAALMTACFGDRWQTFADQDRARIVGEWCNIGNSEKLVSRLVGVWGAAEPQARKLAGERPPKGHCHLSRQALRRLLPLMERGMPYMTAVDEVYGVRYSGGQVYGQLPPVREILPQLRNPAVARGLTEFRKVVNAIVREHGKPAEIRIELGRDLRRPREQRKRIWKESRAREDERDRARRLLESEIGIPKPTRGDIEKFLLWEECGHFCPYTGQPISREALFVEPQFQVEHILPLSRFPDDSFQNKTLCYHEENARKRNRTPFEAYGADPEWPRILERVKNFNNHEKLRRFQMQETDAGQMLEQFSSRQLNDTRYGSRVAADYVGALYGGRDVADPAMPDGKQRRVVFTSTGQVTAILRREWRLGAILPPPPNVTNPAEKARHDHRQHAIDAVVTALATPAWVKRLSDRAAGNLRQWGRASFRGLEGPWPDFVDAVRESVLSINVSHRAEHKVSGQLHEETNYGKPYERTEGGKASVCSNVRKPLSGITRAQIACIVDPAVRQAVERRLQELGDDLKKLQSSGTPRGPEASDALEPPFLVARDGRRIPIYKVRIRQVLSTEKLGQGSRERHVALGNNHHAEIVAELDESGEEGRWEAVVVSRFEAAARLEDMRRKRSGLPVVQRDHGSSRVFKFSLMNGDTVEMADGERRALFIVHKISRFATGQVEFAFCRATDARRVKQIQEGKGVDWPRPGPDGLRKLGCVKVSVDALGRVRPAND